jgi:DNA-binding NarL/FixJ family response regulator
MGAKMEKVSVFLADWQVLFREGIHFTLSGEEDIDVIGEATDNEESLNFIEKNPPMVAILNVNKGKPSGTEVTRRIKLNLPSVAVILVMDSYNDEQLFSAMKCGASACLVKDIDPDELVKIVRKVAEGACPISEALLRPEIASRIIDEFEASLEISDEMDNLLARLLPAEAEILSHIAAGSLIEEITKALNISEGAIKRHLDFILSKLVANDHNREVIEAVQNNLTSIISKISKTKGAGKPSVDFITREEFISFKESLMERLKSFIGELG